MKKPSSAIADIHVVVDIAGERRAVTVAAELARVLDAHLTGFALSFEPLVAVYPMTAPIPTDFVVAAREQAVADAAKAAAAFEKAAAAAGVAYQSRALATITGEGFAEPVRAFRLSDLVVVGREVKDSPEPMRHSLIEAILFDAGAPAMIVPPAVKELKLGRAVVAWDDTVQSSRALRAALPLLARTGAVDVVMVSEAWKWTAGVPGADIADHLARHGISVTVNRIDNTRNDVGATLLDAAAKAKADWLLMGAYGHNRMRQLLLGGATRTVLAGATIPVFLVH
jgi:nucleotide-binding universal stress UspA family protein